ncbi:AbrB/MazE/SpoVT family DNA-binding domain-containing protein [Sphingomonas koreensis]|nr:AbrB/MazE/SpoVT family DNA-binding domain-containing protein [Sphingomonas koreensis]
MAKVFWSGRSQAVRLPKAYRFEGSEVRIRREGDKVILEPAADGDHDWIERLAGRFDQDFSVAALDRPGPEDMPEGPSFD